MSAAGTGGPGRDGGPEAVRLSVHGRVQGVGFRYFVLRQARRLGLTGRVRNLPDGSVEARVRGSRAGIDELVVALRAGPPVARVERVEEHALAEAPEWRDFAIDDFQSMSTTAGRSGEQTDE